MHRTQGYVLYMYMKFIEKKDTKYHIRKNTAQQDKTCAKIQHKKQKKQTHEIKTKLAMFPNHSNLLLMYRAYQIKIFIISLFTNFFCLLSYTIHFNIKTIKSKRYCIKI